MTKEENVINRKPDLDKVSKEYNEWIKKVRVFPCGFYNVMATVSLIAAIIIYNLRFSGRWIFLGILSIVCIKCLSVIAERIGHKEGYMDGYKDGYEQGRDDALGIDADKRHFMDIESKKL